MGNVQMHNICFFNNKGGVGKTTLLCNVAAFLATTYKKKVLIVDADPQCNATQLVLTPSLVNSIYKTPSRILHRTRRSGKAVTLLDILKPIAAGEPDINTSITPISSRDNRFGVDLIPGHPQLALLEDKLSQSWLGFGGGDLGGARITNWNTQLAAAVGKSYDLAFYDVGPSLGALNRSVLVGTDYFLTPMGCDIFSIMGITNIASWFEKWLGAYSDAIRKCSQTWDISDYKIHTDITTIARFIGFTVQQYITKSKEGVRRPTKAYEKIIEDIPGMVHEQLRSFYPPHLRGNDLRLPDVPHMYSLVPLAQNANCPIHDVGSADGLVGAQYGQQTEYVRFIRALSRAVLKNLPKK